MTHSPRLTCLNASIDFPLFYNRLASHKRHICAHALAWPYPKITHSSVRTPTRSVHLLSSSARCSPSLCYSLWLP
ncbi:unnamed protein product [Hymenolepis diminuta]|uniref:Uncharacterized protein n=1 Tax=Hymenolepis diminuta TaxID=6216 RepID=A0A564YR70_HYMDI|nr:unnamed protein product [Hymenolepis diminuta]